MWTKQITHHGSRAAYWNVQPKEADTTVTEAAGDLPSCWRVQSRFVRTTPTGTREDIAMCTMHITKNAGGGARARGITSELSALETLLDTFWGSIAAQMTNQYTLSEYRWFNVAAGDPLSTHGYPLHGGPVRTTGKALTGSITLLRNPDQLSPTITFKTASRKHWGRIYLPGITQGMYEGTYGRLSNSGTDILALAARTLGNSLAGHTNGIYELGVWSPRGLAWLDTLSIQVDNVPDVIRRRRAKQASYFKRYTA